MGARLIVAGEENSPQRVVWRGLTALWNPDRYRLLGRIRGSDPAGQAAARFRGFSNSRGGHCGTLSPLSLRQDMKASLFYRSAAVLPLLFAVGHTLGFRESDPSWGVETLLASMRSIHFEVQGFSRTYWDLFVAAGFSVGVLYLFAAVLAWQLGGLPPETLAAMRVTAWALAVCFAAITVLSWRYLFMVPIVFSIMITVCLTAAAWLSGKQI